jgi:hypothetical protein
VQAIGIADGLDAYPKAQGEPKQVVAGLHDIDHPSGRRATRDGAWGGRDVKGRRQVELLPDNEQRRMDAVGFHERKGGGAGS